MGGTIWAAPWVRLDEGIFASSSFEDRLPNASKFKEGDV